MKIGNTEQERKVIVLYFSRYQDDDSAGKFARFVDSYKNHPAGYEHELFIIKKGFQEYEETWTAWTQQLDGIPFQIRAYPDRYFFFGYVRNLMEEFPDRYILICPSTSEILVDNWLDLYMRHANPNRILGSMCYYSWAPEVPKPKLPALTLKNFLRSSSTTRRNWWKRFCGHEIEECETFSQCFYPLTLCLRTAGFMVPPHLLEQIFYWPRSEDFHDKMGDIALECGKFSLTVQALLAGLEPLIVSSDGRAYPIEEWFASGTFVKLRPPAFDWKGGYKNLIIRDHRSQEYNRLSLGEQNEYVSIEVEAENINQLLKQIHISDASEIASVFPKFQMKSR